VSDGDFVDRLTQISLKAKTGILRSGDWNERNRKSLVPPDSRFPIPDSPLRSTKKQYTGLHQTNNKTQDSAQINNGLQLILDNALDGEF